MQGTPPIRLPLAVIRLNIVRLRLGDPFLDFILPETRRSDQFALEDVSVETEIEAIEPIRHVA